MMQCSNDYLEYVFDQMCDDFKKLETVHLDETPLQIIEDCKDGRKKDMCGWARAEHPQPFRWRCTSVQEIGNTKMRR